MEGVGHDFHIWELTMSSLSLSGAIVVVLVYYALPAYRVHPSELILLIAICDFFLSLRFWLRAFAWILDPAIHDPVRSFHVFDDGCVSSLVWSSFFETASMCWNAVWCFNFMMQLRFPTLNTRKYLPRYHAYVWFVTCAVVALQIGSGGYGGIVYEGYTFCGLVPYNLKNPFVVMEFVLSTLQLCVGFASLVYVQLRLRDVEHHLGSKTLLNMHRAYVLVYLILWFVHRIVTVVPGEPTMHKVVALLWQAQAFFIAWVRLGEPGLLPSFLEALGVPPDLTALWFPHQGDADSGFAADITKPLVKDYNSEQEGEEAASGSMYTSFRSETGDVVSRDRLGTSGMADSRGGRRNTWGPSPAVLSELEVADSFGRATAEDEGPVLISSMASLQCDDYAMGGGTDL